MIDPLEDSRPENSRQDHSPGEVHSSVLEAIRARIGAQASPVMAEVVQAYLREAPAMLAQMGLGLEQSDALLIERAAHTLKTSSALIGAAHLSEVCAKLETDAQRERLSHAKETIDQISDAYDQVKTILQDELRRFQS